MDEHNQQITGGSVNAEKCEVSREKNRLVPPALELDFSEGKNV